MLRPLSPRPTLTVDNFVSRRIVDNQAPSGTVGQPSPLGSLNPPRVVGAIQSPDGPVQLAGAKIVHGIDGFYLADPSNNVIGTPAVWVHRMVVAKRVSNTRRIF
jgi:hypothetical protein